MKDNTSKTIDIGYNFIDTNPLIMKTEITKLPISI